MSHVSLNNNLSYFLQCSGDNPSCSRGPPLSIGWKHDPQKLKRIAIDSYENHPSRKDRPQVHEFDLLMDRTEREQTLLDLGYTKAEIAAATRQTLKDKKKRRQTADNLSACFMEEKVEGMKKSLRRRLLLKKGTKAMYKDWKKKDRAEVDSLGRVPRGHSILVLGSESESTVDRGCRRLSDWDRTSEITSEPSDGSLNIEVLGGKKRHGRRMKPENRRASL